MATYEKGILGPFSGKVGSVIGSNWRSIDYLRSLPRVKKTKKKPSEKLLTQQTKFSMAIDFLGPWRKFIDLIPDVRTVNSTVSNFHVASSDLIKKISGQYPDLTIPYHEVEFTRGQLMNILPKVTSSPEEIKITWPTVLGFGASEKDVVNLIIYNESVKDGYFFNDSLREMGEKSLFIDELGEGIMHIWTVVISVDGTKWSNSKYCGSFTFGDL